MSQASERIAQQFIDGGVVAGDLTGGTAASKAYVDQQLAIRDVNINKADGKAGAAQVDISQHKSSTTAHPAEHITYSGKVPGSSNVKQGLDNVYQRVDQIIAGGDSSAEVVDARGGFPVLSGRLNAVDAQLADTANEINKVPPSFGAFDFVARAATNDEPWKDWFAGIGCDVVWDEATQKYAMVYCGAQAGGTTKFGLAYSDDGITWSEYKANPFFAQNSVPGQPDSGGVTYPQLHYDNGQWYMYYIAFPYEGFEAGESNVCYATAASLLGPWTRHGAVVTKTMFPASENITMLYRPNIIKVGLKWYMFMNAGPAVGVEDIWYFTADSLDGSWTLGQKVLSGTQFQGGTLAADPDVIKFGNRFVMVLHVSNGLCLAYCNENEFPNTWHVGNELPIVGDPQRPVWVEMPNGPLLFVNTNGNKHLDIYRPSTTTISKTDQRGMHGQAIINGNFDVWQRGASFSKPWHLTFLADRWRVVNAYFEEPALTVSKQELLPGDVPYSSSFLRINVSGPGNNFNANGYAEHGIRQDIENGTRFLCRDGKGVTLSFYARSNIPNKKIAAYAFQNYGTGGSPTPQENVFGKVFTLTPQWKRYTVVLTTYTLEGKTFGTNNDDALIIMIDELWGASTGWFFGTNVEENYSAAGSIDIAQVVVNVGKFPTMFAPKSISDELLACQRYFQIRSTNNVNPIDLRPSMRKTPTISGTGPYNYDAEL